MAVCGPARGTVGVVSDLTGVWPETNPRKRAGVWIEGRREEGRRLRKCFPQMENWIRCRTVEVIRS